MADTPVDFWRGTFQFVSLSGNYGWSEVYFVGEPDLSHAAGDFSTLWPLRVAILTNDCQLAELRISQEGVFGDAATPLTSAQVGLIDATMRPVVDKWSCLLIRTGVADRKSRGHKFLHGVPKDFFAANDGYDIGNASNAAVQSFVTALGGPPYCLRSARKDSAVAYPNLTGAIPVRKTEHAIGRPFGQRRGRRSGV